MPEWDLFVYRDDDNNIKAVFSPHAGYNISQQITM